MEWKETTLADCCESIYDGDHQAPPKVDRGIPFITISNITNHQIDFTNTLYTTQEYYDHLDEKRKVRKGDVLYSVVGSFGIPVFQRENRAFIFQRHIALLRPDAKKIVPAFLYYSMLNPSFYAQADTIAIGAAQRTITLSALRKMTLRLPAYDVQGKIVGIIAPYDRLIENHRRQIALLEEAAQRIYKEWFVDSHPSHDAWTSCPLPDLMDVCYGKDHKGLADGPYPVYGSGGYLRSVDQYLYNKESILIPRKGSLNNILYVDEAFWTVDTMFYTKLKRPDVGFYLYNYLLRIDMYAMNTGAAVPSMTTNVLNKMMIPLPPQDDLAHFSDAITPMHQEIKFLKHKVQLLSEARDRLLPKLLSGEIEV